MTWDDEEERRIATWESVRADCAELLKLPIVSRVQRARAWCGRLRRFDVDWSGFAVTRGGFFGWFGIPEPNVDWWHGRPPLELLAGMRGRAMERLAVGLDLPISSVGWQQWERWYPSRPFTMRDYLPTISAERGGISVLRRSDWTARPLPPPWD